MDSLIDSLLLANGVILITTIALALLTVFTILRVRRLVPDPCGLSRRHLVTAIVPARNEQADIKKSIESLLAQKHVDMEIIVVDDHSTDRTGEILDQIAGEDSRVRVFHEPELRPGWLGKQNAMRLAFEETRGNYVLFTDADIVHSPTSVSTGLLTMERDELDFLSCFPEVRCESLFENAILPVYIGGFLELLRSDPEDPKSDVALAAGAYMLTRPQVIRESNGLHAVRSKALDDVELARHLKKLGYRLQLRFAPQLASVRLFKGNLDAFWGITKNVLAALKDRTWLAPIAAVAPFVLFWLPLVSIALGLTIADDARLTLIALGTYAIQYAMLFSTWSVITFRPITALLFPLCAFSVAACIVRALMHRWLRGAVCWRGRSIRIVGDSGTDSGSSVSGGKTHSQDG